MRHRLVTCGLLGLICGFGTAQAQIPSLPGTGVSSLSGIGAGNAAGVLSYCVKNKYLGGGDASSVLGALSKKPGVTTSREYAAGQAGLIAPAKGKGLSLGNVKGNMKSQVCDMVLDQAKTLL